MDKNIFMAQTCELLSLYGWRVCWTDVQHKYKPEFLVTKDNILLKVACNYLDRYQILISPTEIRAKWTRFPDSQQSVVAKHIRKLISLKSLAEILEYHNNVIVAKALEKLD